MPEWWTEARERKRQTEWRKETNEMVGRKEEFISGRAENVSHMSIRMPIVLGTVSEFVVSSCVDNSRFVESKHGHSLDDHIIPARVEPLSKSFGV